MINLNDTRINAARSRVLLLLSDLRWHSTTEINTVGGTEGTRRLRELRNSLKNSEKYFIEKRHVKGHLYEYRMKKI